MSDLAAGQIGPEASYEVSFSGGAFQVSVKYGGQQASASMAVSVSAAQLVGALASKVSNPTEKAILIALEGMIAGIP